MNSAVRMPSIRKGRRTLLATFTALAFTFGSVAALAPPAEAIVGGRNATQEYSHMAAFLDNGRQICGASLIAPQWVLSAAHCVGSLEPSRYSFLLGRDHLNDAGGETIGAAEVIVHPQYVDTYDVALFRLQRASVYEPIALAHPEEDRHLWEVDDIARVIGYGGQAFPGLLADGQLREVDVPVVDDADCDLSYALLFGGIDEETEVCAGELYGTKDSCQGDSGGPLMVPDEQGDYVQMGVVSWGFGCGWPTQYGVYSRVGDHTLYDWIQETIGSSGGGEDPDDPVEPPPSETETVTVEPQGYIAGAAPAPQEGVTATELEFTCSTDLVTQSVDGYAWELPAELAVPGAVAKVTGDSLFGHDLDLGFYGEVDGSCTRLGWVGSIEVDESGDIPAGTQFVLAHNWFGVDTFVDLTVDVPVAPSAVETSLELSDDNPVEARYNDETTFEARLTDAAGEPLADQPVRFALLDADGHTIQFAPGTATDENGVSTVSMRLGVAANNYTLEAVFIGRPDELQEASAEAPFSVLTAESALTVAASGTGNKRQVTATLTEAASDLPLAGRSVELFANCESLGSAETAEDGTARLALGARHRAPTTTFSALFAGDDGSERYYDASSAGPAC